MPMVAPEGEAAKKEKITQKVIQKKSRWRVALALALVIVLALALWMDGNLKPIVVSMAEAQCKALAVGVLNASIRTVLNSGIDYGDLMEVRFDSDGRVTMMQANTVRMNALSTSISKEALSGLQKLNVARIGIPLGSALGSKLFAGEGPRIPVKVHPVGAVNAGFSSEFETSGINQTRHKVYLRITATVQIVIPTDARVISVTESVLVAESIIVGQVPERFYSGGFGGGMMLDLVP
ncbi:MAG: sporulation protein YunB [Clostridia bacterium]|nr:sporulation protein YunB [Clostridia bacterium]